MRIITILANLFIYLSTAAQPIEPLIDSLEGMLKKKNIPGATLTIVRSDSILFTGGIGYADIKNEERVSIEHLFRFGSVSKSFTALAMMKLVEDGKLKLSDNVLDIDPSLPIKNAWKNESPITIENLLEHTAGFDDMHYHALYNIEDKIIPTAKEMLLKHETSLVVRWKPGTRHSYSNVGYMLAGYIIEKTSGKPFRRYLKEEILNPIGMKSAGFYFTKPHDTTPMSKGYKYMEGENQEQSFLPMNIEAAGGLCANALDMQNFLQFVLNKVLPSGDTLLSVEAFERIEYPQTTLAAQVGLPFGYGLGNSNDWVRGYHFHEHNGGVDGFGSHYTYSVDADLGIAISINHLVSPGPFLQMIFDHFLERKQETVNRKIVSIPKGITEKYDGFYTNQSPRHQTNTFIDQVTEGIYLNFHNTYIIATDMYGDLIDTLWYAGDNKFYFGNSNHPTNALLEDGKGSPIIVSSLTYYKKSSGLYQWLRLGFIVLALLSLFGFLAYGIIWALIQIIRKRSISSSSRLVLWLACIGFLMIPFGLVLTLLDMIHANKINFAGLSIFIGSIMFFLLSILAVLFSFKQKSESTLFRIYYGLTAFLVCGLSFYLLLNNVIGFKMWSY